VTSNHFISHRVRVCRGGSTAPVPTCAACAGPPGACENAAAMRQQAIAAHVQVEPSNSSNSAAAVDHSLLVAQQGPSGVTAAGRNCVRQQVYTSLRAAPHRGWWQVWQLGSSQPLPAFVCHQEGPVADSWPWLWADAVHLIGMHRGLQTRGRVVCIAPALSRRLSRGVVVGRGVSLAAPEQHTACA
jgi:hypothetical protein